MSEPEFKVGDVVYHKASSRRAVVTRVNEKCGNDEHYRMECGVIRMHKTRFLMPEDDLCEMEWDGTYQLSVDFSQDGTLERVPEYLLVAVAHDGQIQTTGYIKPL